LSIGEVARLSEEEARRVFQLIRFEANEGQPFCVRCGCVALNSYKCRPIWKCKACGHQFSVTSGTIFADRKLPVRDYLLAIAIFANGAKGISALQLGRDLCVQYKTAFVLAHKLREAMAPQGEAKLDGTVEVDGGYFGGHVKPENRIEDRKDRRLLENQSGKKRCVVVMRERGGRTLPFVVSSEDVGVPVVRAKVEKSAELHADEAAHWNVLHAHYQVRRIHHGKAYSADGACTNQAESFFSRMRRSEIGVHHHFSGPYLQAYAEESAWREDNRRASNGRQFQMLVSRAAQLPVSTRWARYWQRSKPSAGSTRQGSPAHHPE